MIAAILVGFGVYALSNWERERDFRPLYTALAPEDAAVIVQKLKESATPFRLTSNGTTISVPEERVAELRLEMAGAGVPKSGRIGFEIFDKTNFGMTDFAEHVNYRRALEGELERSVMTVAEIEQARVHISLPQESVFLEARQPAKASVLIRIHPGSTLPESAVPAITNLVASAVEGLAPEMVSVLDMRGNLLNRPKRTPGSQGGDQSGSDSALEYRHRVEQDLTAKLNSTLEPLVGAGRFRAAVSAECDLTSADQSEENLDPTHSVMVTSQKTEDVTSPSHTSSASGGIPGTASNLPDPAPKPTTTGGGVSRKTENISYQTSRLVKHTILPQGAIKKLSVSVLLDQDVRWEGSGPNAKRILAVPTPEKMKTIHDLVAAAAGLDTQRGDQLIVESLPFESTLNLEPPPVFDAPAGGHPKQLTPLEQLKSDPKLMIGLGVGALVVLLVVVFGIRQMLRKPAPVKAYAQAALPAPEAAADRGAVSGESDAWSPASLSSSGAGSKTPALAAGRVEALTTQLRAAAQKDVQVSAGVLRGWIREESA